MKKIAAAIVLALVVSLCSCANMGGTIVIQSLRDLTNKNMSNADTDKIVNALSGYIDKQPNEVDGDYIWDRIDKNYYNAKINAIRLHTTSSGKREIVLSGPVQKGETEEDMFSFIDGFIEWVKSVNEATKTTGTAYIDDSEWESALSPALWDYEKKAKEAYYLTMRLSAIAGMCRLKYNWDRHSAEAHMTMESYSIEYTVYIDN